MSNLRKLGIINAFNPLKRPILTASVAAIMVIEDHIYNQYASIPDGVVSMCGSQNALVRHLDGHKKLVQDWFGDGSSC